MDKYNLIIIIVDALRASNVHYYGYDEETTPNIDSIARRGVVFKNAFSSTNVTDPSITTILTGKVPFHHGIINHGGKVSIKEKILINYSIPLPLILKRNGYSTYAIDILARWHKRGFEHYYAGSNVFSSFIRRALKKASIYNSLPSKLKSLLSPKYNSKKATELALRIIKKNKNNPFFLFIHYWNTHTPYEAPKKYWLKFLNNKELIPKDKILKSIHNPEWRSYLGIVLKKGTNAAIARYNGAINYIDMHIGKIVRALEENDLMDRTIIVITGDHGESLLEHGIYFDHHGLYDVSIHVPLIMLFPGCPKGKIIDEFVQHQDLMPTLLDILNIKYKKELGMGKSLLPVIDGSEAGHEWLFFYELYAQSRIAYRDKKFKLIIDPTNKYNTCRLCGRKHGDSEELYDIVKDPNETINLSLEEKEIVKELRTKLLRHYKLLYKNFKMRSLLKLMSKKYLIR